MRYPWPRHNATPILKVFPKEKGRLPEADAHKKSPSAWGGRAWDWSRWHLYC
jgi:hypothetical protein